jgi:hypothetical protein
MEQDLWPWIASFQERLNANLDWESLRDFGNSTFFTSIAGAFAGAWAGGRIAQVLAIRARDKEELARELRNTNAAATMSSALCDDLAAILRQHIMPMKEQFDSDLAIVTALLAAPSPSSGTPPTIQANLQHLSGPSLHTAPLQQLVFNDVSNNRAIRLYTTLNQTVSTVHGLIEKRNLLIDEFRASPNPHAVLRHGYFGLPSPTSCDDRYKSALYGLHTALQDGVYFSMNLALLLADHAGDLAGRYKKRFGKPVPRAIELDFSRLAERGVMPDRKDYPDWEALLSPPRKLTNFERLKKRIRREECTLRLLTRPTSAWGKYVGERPKTKPL